MSQRKGFKRYSSGGLRELVKELDAAKAELKGLQEQLLAAHKAVREAEAGAC